MEIGWTQVFMIVGFMLAAYSIVANDAIQTLGTFLSSNSHRAWWILWLYACSILVAVLIYGWIVNDGDPAYGRLSKFPEPEGGIGWIHVVPPLFILFLTRFGVPVSTTFLILTVFAPTNMGKILMKSMLGYGVAIVVGLIIYIIIARWIEKRFILSDGSKPGWYWVVLQWASTGFLWSQWLVQDLANIFVYLPRTIGAVEIGLATVLMLALHAIIFARRGGEIQKIVTSKTNSTDIRSATIIDFTYGLILLYFKQISNIPMSTTWVFLGLLAGRQIAISLVSDLQTRVEMERLKREAEEGKMLGSDPSSFDLSTRYAFRTTLGDVGKALAGLVISVALGLGLPYVDRLISGGGSAEAADPLAKISTEAAVPVTDTPNADIK